jgi:hypothetical protein
MWCYIIVIENARSRRKRATAEPGSELGISRFPFAQNASLAGFRREAQSTLSGMSEPATSPHRQQQLYWAQMTELKVAACYIRYYSDYLGRRVTALGTLRAIASSGSIAAWALWREYAFVWGAIIAAAQVADALKDVFPFTKTHEAASAHTITLGGIFIDAQLEWENIFSGRYTDDQIMNRRHKLMKVQHDAERTSFPDGLATRDPLFAQAEQDARDYFTATYGVY